MGLIRSIGNLIQETLFTSTFADILESIDDVRRRVETLEEKIKRNARKLEEEIARLEARDSDEKEP